MKKITLLSILIGLVFAVESFGQKYQEGYTVIEKKGKKGLVFQAQNEKPVVAIEPEMEDIKFAHQQDLYDKYGTVIFCKKGKWKAMHFSGKYGVNITDFEFNEIRELGDRSSNTFVVTSSENKIKWLVYKILGDASVLTTPSEFYDNFDTKCFTPYYKDYVLVQKDNKWGIVTVKGEQLVEPIYSSYETVYFSPAASFIYLKGDKQNLLITIDKQNKWTKEIVESASSLNGSNGQPKRVINGDEQFWSLEWKSVAQEKEKDLLLKKGFIALNTGTYTINVYYNWYNHCKVIGSKMIDVNADIDNSPDIFRNAPENWLGVDDNITKEKGMSGSMTINISENNSTIEKIKSDFINDYKGLAPIGVNNILQKSVTLKDGRKANYLLFYSTEMEGIGFEFKFIVLIEQGGEKIYSEIDMEGERTGVLQKADFEKWAGYFLPVLESIKKI